MPAACAVLPGYGTMRLSPLLGLCLICSSVPLGATETPSDTPTSSPDLLQQSLRLAEQTRDRLSTGIVMLSDSIDRFFGANREIERTNRTQLRFYNSNTLVYGSRPASTLKTHVKLDLPRTNERLSLVIESNSLQQEADKEKDIDQSNVLPQRSEGETAITSSLQYLLRQSTRWNVRASAGLRLTRRPEVVTRLKARHQMQRGHWQLRLSQMIFWYSSTRLGETTRLELEHPLGEQHLFRASSHVTWRQRLDTFELSQYLTVFQQLGAGRYLAYQLSAEGENRPRLHTSRYTAHIYFRKMLYKDWIFLDIVPLMLWQRSQGFRPSPSFSINLELVLGATPAGH